MKPNTILAQYVLSLTLATSFALAEEETPQEQTCDDEKGPCCNLDWTGQGATIVKINGEGLVSQSPYVKATVGMRVRNGGRVIALDRSAVVVGFDDGCWHVVKENEMLTIEDVSPCCAARLPPAPVAPATPPPPAGLSGIPLGPVAAGAAAIGVCAATDCLGGTGSQRPPISR